MRLDVKFEACLLLVLNVFALGLLIMTSFTLGRRGPHHPRGQHPVDFAHHHYRPSADSLTADTGLLHDARHIEEDSPVLTAEMLAAMTPEELEFHYFSAHDFDRNSKLDGLELLKAVFHTIEHEEPDLDSDASIEQDYNDLESYITLVDRTLDSDDTDGDGFVSYAEYRAARARNPVDRTPRVLAANTP